VPFLEGRGRVSLSTMPGSFRLTHAEVAPYGLHCANVGRLVGVVWVLHFRTYKP
jgi:hypothetical protein